jgi:large conductance mechanosensitive channel
MSGFMKFIREQGVVGLAVGFILGGAVGKLVASLVEDIINPLIGLLLGNTSGLASMSIGVVNLGSFIAIVIEFIIIAAVVYFVFKWLKLDKLDAKKED